jgi:hypothetical protein
MLLAGLMMTSAGRITVVGLGPGSPGAITRDAWAALERAPRVRLRTTRHPAVPSLPCEFLSYDELYEEAADGTPYDAIVDDVMKLAQCDESELVYAVPVSLNPHQHPSQNALAWAKLQSSAFSSRVPTSSATWSYPTRDRATLAWGNARRFSCVSAARPEAWSCRC